MLRDRTADGPDFIGIGLPSSGTRWAYDALAAHPLVRMPLIKELHFLDRGVRTERLRKLRAQPRWKLARRHRRFIRAYERSGLLDQLTAHEARFHARKRAELLTDLLPSEAEFDLYGQLFRPFRPFVTGEITPDYYRVPDRTIDAFATRFPGARYLLMVRHPVDRLLSSLNKCVAKGLITRTEAEHRLAVATTNHAVYQPSPSGTFQRWSERVGESAVHVTLLDDVIADPAAAQRAIHRFLGLPSLTPWVRVAGNRKEGLNPHTVRGDRDALRQAFASEIAECQRLFGGATLRW